MSTADEFPILAGLANGSEPVSFEAARAFVLIDRLRDLAGIEHHPTSRPIIYDHDSVEENY